ncbi:hypothetical protein HELRODRAFT_160581 [Helobdella robusta]|uniref:Uncharacterized protein n=1 Tax=Helobdella robusta TaxID=6412 RepID=T1EQG0_HELRO|nr:hypothetical protein HELRODRAFT_160581 [Helobdella robusta]ESO06410.1 hypothetical protein HELRODRAFT_160581 [Helobdella robusta]
MVKSAWIRTAVNVFNCKKSHHSTTSYQSHLLDFFGLLPLLVTDWHKFSIPPYKACHNFLKTLEFHLANVFTSTYFLCETMMKLASEYVVREDIIEHLAAFAQYLAEHTCLSLILILPLMYLPLMCCFKTMFCMASYVTLVLKCE